MSEKSQSYVILAISTDENEIVDYKFKTREEAETACGWIQDHEPYAGYFGEFKIYDCPPFEAIEFDTLKAIQEEYAANPLAEEEMDEPDPKFFNKSFSFLSP